MRHGGACQEVRRSGFASGGKVGTKRWNTDSSIQKPQPEFGNRQSDRVTAGFGEGLIDD